MQTNTKRKKNLLIIGILLLSVAVIGGTIAYFSASFSVTEEIKTADFAYRAVNKFNAPGNWLPGDTANPELKVTNTANTPLAIRAKITETWVSGNSTTLDNKLSNGEDAAVKTIGTDWKKIGSYYYYNGTLTEDQTTPTSLISAVTFNSAAGENINCEAVEGNEDQHRCSNTSGYGGARYTITVAYDIMQASAIEDTWGISQTQIATANISSPNNSIVAAYTYNESTCQTGRESTCQIAMCAFQSNVNCPVGTIIDYQVDSSTTDNTEPTEGTFPTSGIMRFHVISDTDGTLTMQSQKNVVIGTAWYAASNDNSQGPTTIVPALEAATNGWSNVNTLNTTYPSATAKCDTSFNCTTGYPDYSTGNANKARLISLSEVHAIDPSCTTSEGSCQVKWLINFLNQHTTYNNVYYDSTTGNNGYWTSSAYGSSTYLAWGVAYGGLVGGNTSYTTRGARAVVEITK